MPANLVNSLGKLHRHWAFCNELRVGDCLLAPTSLVEVSLRHTSICCDRVALELIVTLPVHERFGLLDA